MRKLREIFKAHNGRQIYKVDHYFDIYDRHVAKFIDTDVCVLEIGISHGGSLQMWKEYFGSKARIYGIDWNPDCKDFEEDRIKIFIGDQADRGFLESTVKVLPRIDIVIDDGGHRMKQQIISFEDLFPAISDGGVYICEDTNTSYKRKWGGGRRASTFIEYSKRLVDQLNTLKMDLYSVCFYTWLLVVEKGSIGKPEKVKT